MAPDDTNQDLENLRLKIIDKLASMSDQLTDNDAVGFEALLNIARSTNKPELLDKALQKVDSLPEPGLKVDALLDLLDEVDARLNSASPAEEPAIEDSQQPNETAPQNP